MTLLSTYLEFISCHEGLLGEFCVSHMVLEFSDLIVGIGKGGLDLSGGLGLTLGQSKQGECYRDLGRKNLPSFWGVASGYP